MTVESKRPGSVILSIGLPALVMVLLLWVGYWPLRICPACQGKGLLRAPSEEIQATRWVSANDLVPEPCEFCGNHSRVSLFKRWRWNPTREPHPPLYRAGNLGAFMAGQMHRIDQIALEVTRGTEGQPPSGSSRRPDMVPILAAAVDDEDPKIRLKAVSALAQMNHESALPILQKALRHSDYNVQRAAITGLGWLLRQEPLQGSILKDLKMICEKGSKDSLDVRLEASSLLLDVGELRSGDVFVEAIRSSWYSQVPIVIKGIARFNRKDAILRIIKRMASSNPGTAREEQFGQCLEFLTGEKLGEDPVRWYHWLEKNRANLPVQLE